MRTSLMQVLRRGLELLTRECTKERVGARLVKVVGLGCRGCALRSKPLLNTIVPLALFLSSLFSGLIFIYYISEIPGIISG